MLTITTWSPIEKPFTRNITSIDTLRAIVEALEPTGRPWTVEVDGIEIEGAKVYEMIES